MSEFNSPWVREAGLRVSRGCWGWDEPVGSWCCTPAAGAESVWCQRCLGPCTCCGQLEEQKVPWSEFPRELWFCRTLSQSLLLLLLTDPHPYVMQVCCLLICQICWLRCKWIETDCRDFQICKHTKAGTSSGYL